jgi:hypothetical protein
LVCVFKYTLECVGYTYVDFLKAVRIFREKYGNIFSLSLGKFWIIVVNEANTIRELLLKKGEHMLDRPPLYAFSFNGLPVTLTSVFDLCI